MLFLALLLATQASPRAIQLLRDHHPREAVEVLSADLAKKPQDRELRRILVACEMSLKSFRAALAHLPDGDSSFDDLRGRILFELGSYEEALTFLDVEDPEQTLMVVEAHEALGRMSEADRSLEKAISVLGADHLATLVLNGRRLMRSSLYAEAVVCFEKARSLDRWHPAALFGLGTALVRSGEREKGIAVLEEHRRIVPMLDELEFALSSLALDPSHAPNHAYLGDVERSLGRKERAGEAYRKAFDLAKAEELVPITLRFARFVSEDLLDDEGAVDLLRRGNAKHASVRLLVREGDLLEKLVRLEEARVAWLRALGMRPEDPAIRARIQRLAERR